jgi:hypothetical protein
VTVLTTTTVAGALSLGVSNRTPGETKAALAHGIIDRIEGVASFDPVVILCFRSQADAASDRSRAIKAANIEMRILT